MRPAVWLALAAAALSLGAAPPAMKPPVVKVANWWSYAGAGAIGLPGGKSQPVRLVVTEWEGNSFRGYLDYDLGWKHQTLPIEGAVDPVKGRISFQEPQDAGPHIPTLLKRGRVDPADLQPRWHVHPFSPVLGKGKFEGSLGETFIQGTALVWLKAAPERPHKTNFGILLSRPLKPGEAGPPK